MGSTPQPVVVTGEVERPLTVRPDELERLAGDEATVDFHCHEGWTRPWLAAAAGMLDTLRRGLHATTAPIVT